MIAKVSKAYSVLYPTEVVHVFFSFLGLVVQSSVRAALARLHFTVSAGLTVKYATASELCCKHMLYFYSLQ